VSPAMPHVLPHVIGLRRMPTVLVSEPVADFVRPLPSVQATCHARSVCRGVVIDRSNDLQLL
jgi:hypothetical protein